MEVKPRKIAPGWARRWPQEAFQLMSRAWILWMGIAALVAVVCQWTEPKLAQLLLLPIGVFAFSLSTAFAQVSDEKYVTGEDVLQALRQSVHMTREHLTRRWKFVVTVVGFYLTVCAIVYALPVETDALALSAPTSTIGPSELWRWLLLRDSPLSNAGFCMAIGGWLQVSGFSAPGFGVCLHQRFGDMDDETTESLLQRAVAQNRAPFIAIQSFYIGLMWVFLNVPVVGWALGVFAPVLTYVAFREVFTDSGGNRRRAPRTVRNRISLTASKSA